MYTPLSTSITEDGPLSEYAQIITNLNNSLVPAFALVSGAPVKTVQDVAASETVPLFVADRVMTISSVKAYAYTATAQADEHLVVDVKKNGTSVCSATITINQASSTNVVSAALKTDGTCVLAVGDKVTVVYAYTAGASATPMAITNVSVGLTV